MSDTYPGYYATGEKTVGIQFGVTYETIMTDLPTVVSVGHSFFNVSGRLDLPGNFG